MPLGFGKGEEKETTMESSKDAEKADMEKVEKIVEKMRKKYSAQGMTYGEDTGKMSELRGIISGSGEKSLEVQKIEDLKDSDSKMVSGLGILYLKLGFITAAFYKLFEKLPWSKQIEYYLYSADMRYSGKQWLALTTIASLIAFTFILIVLLLSMPFTNLPLWISLFLSFLAFGFAAVIMGLIPKQRAQTRGKMISRELPFALRHIATQLSAGIGLYRTLQTVASADYGALSEEFSRTITEIEEGTDTQVALRHLALRTESSALRNALMHTIRALKTGGNLSNIMNEIAEDVSFELRMKMREFGEKMNFLGVILIFMAIVLPVFVAILGGVRNSPISSMVDSGFKSIPLTPDVILIFYVIVMPAILLWLFMFIMMIQPHV
ncbi:MAG: type II secretion system F family protein [Candidatus Diapherotrites archaeon]|nr:type II secretion system F family protein [Candidatus Diapherotrites archaeon]